MRKWVKDVGLSNSYHPNLNKPQTKRQRSPQLRGLSGFLCLILLVYARRGIIPTQSSLVVYLIHHKPHD